MLSYARYPIQEESGLKPVLTPTQDNQVWVDDGALESASYIEAYSYGDGDSSYPSSRYGVLHGEEILDWVFQKGSYQPIPSENGLFHGAVRLLILERSLYQPASFDIRKETYSAIAEHFHLPETTLIGLSSVSGISIHTLDVNEDTGSPERLSMLIKASQKFQVGNYGLAFSHNFDTGITTGILHGTGVAQYGKDYELWGRPPIVEIFEHINTAHKLWTHPLFLPTIVLQHHLSRTEYFVGMILNNKYSDLQFQLGTMRGGRLTGVPAQHFGAEVPVKDAKVGLKALTVAMSTLMFDITWFGVVSDWQCSCLKLLEEVFTEIENLSDTRQRRAMQERIKYFVASAESMRMQNRGMKECGQTDMSILYSIISQVDNRLNAKIAAVASRDSAAMKTLAFLTTLFLPGTFVAAIFSTGMFDWQVGPKQPTVQQSGDEKIVSGLFWVYWAFTVPLTLAVAVGWRVWWSWEKKHFDDDVDAAVQAVDDEAGDVGGLFQHGNDKGFRGASSGWEEKKYRMRRRNRRE